MRYMTRSSLCAQHEANASLGLRGTTGVHLPGKQLWSRKAITVTPSIQPRKPVQKKGDVHLRSPGRKGNHLTPRKPRRKASLASERKPSLPYEVQRRRMGAVQRQQKLKVYALVVIAAVRLSATQKARLTKEEVATIESWYKTADNLASYKDVQMFLTLHNCHVPEEALYHLLEQVQFTESRRMELKALIRLFQIRKRQLAEEQTSKCVRLFNLLGGEGNEDSRVATEPFLHTAKLLGVDTDVDGMLSHATGGRLTYDDFQRIIGEDDNSSDATVSTSKSPTSEASSPPHHPTDVLTDAPQRSSVVSEERRSFAVNPFTLLTRMKTMSNGHSEHSKHSVDLLLMRTRLETLDRALYDHSVELPPLVDDSAPSRRPSTHPTKRTKLGPGGGMSVRPCPPQYHLPRPPPRRSSSSLPAGREQRCQEAIIQLPPMEIIHLPAPNPPPKKSSGRPPLEAAYFTRMFKTRKMEIAEEQQQVKRGG